MAKLFSGRNLAFALLAIAASAPACAAPRDFAAKADAYLRTAYPAAGPGAAVIIVDDGKTVFARGRGLADIAGRTPITPQTIFRLGSITKQFAAAVILQLADEGKLSLDDPLSKFVPSYPGAAAGATVRQLLNHTAGVKSYTELPRFMLGTDSAKPHSTAQMIALFKDHPAPSKPGETFAYNNSGYVLVGAVIEAVTGKPWHQAVDERIARPLGLATVRYGVGEAGFARMAKGYTQGAAGPERARAIHMSVPHAAGALVGSVEDMAKWARALHGGKVVKSASYARMIAPTMMADGKPVPYGFGLLQGKIRGREAIGHNGGIFGFSTDSIYLPKEDLFVAVFANSDAPATATGVALQRLTALALGDPYPSFTKVAVPPATLEPLLGTYVQAEGKVERRFLARNGKLFLHRLGAGESEVFAAGNDRFFFGPERLVWFQIRRDPKGAHVLEIHQAGEVEFDRAVRTGALPPEAPSAQVPRATLQTYVGSYATSFGAFTVALTPDGLTGQLAGQQELPLRPTSQTDFSVVGVEARVVFHLEKGVPTRLVIHQGGQEIVATRAKP